MFSRVTLLLILTTAAGVVNGITRESQPTKYCRTPNGARGRCLPVAKCDIVVNSLLRHSCLPGFLDFPKNVHCGSDNQGPRVCCPQILTEKPKGLVRSSNCLNPHGSRGTCVPITRCPNYLNILLKYRHSVSVRHFVRSSKCGTHGSETMVCCSKIDENSIVRSIQKNQEIGPINKRIKCNDMIRPKNDFRITFPGATNANLRTTPTTTTTTTTTTTKPITKMSKTISTSSGGPTVEKTIELPRFPECGKPGSFSHLLRISHGKEANLGDHPWMAALFGQRSDGTEIYRCGGTLITNQHILTAAHCLVGTKITHVRLGDLNLDTDDDEAQPIKVQVRRFTIHKQYSQQYSDIAIIQLEQAVQFSGKIRPICLPVSAEKRNIDWVGNNLKIAGWGSSSFAGSYNSHLLHANVPIMAETQCKQAYDRFGITIDKTAICASASVDSADACAGDSGGPLMDGTRDGEVYQVGITAFGPKPCAHKEIPGVYTRVATFVDWIQETVNRLQG